MSSQSEPVDYPEILRALGHFIQQQHMSDVHLIEFERGWIVTGLTYKTIAQGFMRVPIDFVISHDEVRKLVTEMRDQRKPGQQARRGWLG